MLMENYARATFDSYEDFAQNFSISVPENYNFAFDCVDVLAQKTPDKPALVWCNESGDEKTYSFSELSVLSDGAARFFRSNGIKKGDRVMLILKRRAQYWYIVLGLMKLGAVSIPATHLLTKKDIAYRNEMASIEGIVAVDDEAILSTIEDAQTMFPVTCLIKLGAAREGWLGFDDGVAACMAGERPERITENDDMMMLYFTSGTTGLPKMVTHNFIYPLGHIITARFWHDLHPGSLHLTVSDTGWAKASWGKMFGQWLCEAAVFVYDHERFNAVKMLEVICKYKLTSFCAPPTVFRFLVREDLRAYDLSSLESVTTAGEPLNPDIFLEFQRLTGIMIREAYGQTEMTPMALTSPYIEARPGSLGKMSPAYDLCLMDEQGEEVQSGEDGEICIRIQPGEVPGVFMGYYRDPDLTESVWSDGLYHTGDRAKMDEDGYLWFIGRNDDMIKSSGYRIGPFEVESALLEHPAVLECAVTSVPDPLRGQAVKASIILADRYLTAPLNDLKKELQDHVKAITAPYKYPRIIDFVTSLPKTISGKIQRVIIRNTPSKAENLKELREI